MPGGSVRCHRAADCNVGADGGARGALRERIRCSSRGGRNKVAARHVGREACLILSDRIWVFFTWHLSTPISRGERKVLAV